jgi:hypothetical protein
MSDSSTLSTSPFNNQISSPLPPLNIKNVD